MRKMTVGPLVLVALLFAAMPSTASAEPLWSVNGEVIATATGAKDTATFKLSDLKASFVGVSTVECKGSLDGTVKPSGAGEVTEFLNVAGEKISGTPLTGTPLECKGITNCEGNGKVWPVGLPWSTQLQEPETGMQDQITDTAKKIGFEVECSVLGIKESDECTQASMAVQLENESTGVATSASEENKASCSLSGEVSGDASWEGLLTPTGGGVLAVNGGTIDLNGSGAFGAQALDKPSAGKVFTLVTTEEKLLIEKVQIVKPAGAGEFRFGTLKVCQPNLLLHLFGNKNTCNTEIIFEPLGDPESSAELEITYEEVNLMKKSFKSASLKGTGV